MRFVLNVNDFLIGDTSLQLRISGAMTHPCLKFRTATGIYCSTGTSLKELREMLIVF
jgi:hypothetical protein